MIEEAVEKLALIMQGRIPEKLDTQKTADNDQRKLARTVNQLIDFIQEIHEFIVPLSKGELTDIRLSPGNFLGSPFKELHSVLLHLTWQTEQIAKGDYSQRIDFMGEFSRAFNSMVESLERNETLLRKKIEELEQALSHIKRLEGILPICASCKKIRVTGGDPKKQEDWVQMESYISSKSEARFSHSICPECMKKLYPDLEEDGD